MRRRTELFVLLSLVATVVHLNRPPALPPESPAPPVLYAVLEDAPSDASPCLRLALDEGVKMLRSGDYTQAVAVFSRVGPDDPYRATALYWRAWALEHLGQREQAARDQAEALRLKPGFAALLNERAWQKARRQEADDQALADINQALALREESTYYDTRGYLLLLRGRAEEALPDLVKAVAGQRRRSHLEHLAMAYEALGQDEEASQTRQEASLAPDYWVDH